jgi:hypothetical protein
MTRSAARIHKELTALEKIALSKIAVGIQRSQQPSASPHAAAIQFRLAVGSFAFSNLENARSSPHQPMRPRGFLALTCRACTDDCRVKKETDLYTKAGLTTALSALGTGIHAWDGSHTESPRPVSTVAIRRSRGTLSRQRRASEQVLIGDVQDARVARTQLRKLHLYLTLKHRLDMEQQHG